MHDRLRERNNFLGESKDHACLQLHVPMLVDFQFYHLWFTTTPNLESSNAVPFPDQFNFYFILLKALT